MHSRHRGPGNGYRSSPRGMGGPPSRYPPENSYRGGNGMFNQEHRNNYGYGYGRGNPRPPPPPPPPQVSPPNPQVKPDIFAEAGRLAAEYLVSKGVLPPNVFTGKWQNGSLKNVVGDYRGFKQHEGESLSNHRSRNGTDSGSGRRRQSDEYSKPDRLETNSREKRRSRSNESDSGREMSRSSSLSEKAKSSLEVEQKGVDSEAGKVGQASSQSKDVKPMEDVTGETQSLANNFQNNDNVAGDGKDLRAETDVESPKAVDDVICLDKETVDGVICLDKETVDSNDGSDSCPVEKQSGDKDVPVPDSAAEDEAVNDSGNNLLTLCTFSKETTQSHSIKGSKDDLLPIREEEKDLESSQGNNNTDGPMADSEVAFKEVTVDDSSVLETTNKVEGSKSADPDSAMLASHTGGLDLMEIDQGKYTRSQSLPLGSFMFEHEPSEGYLNIGRCSSMNMERGEKRTAEDIDDKAVIKKPREWDLTGFTQMDEYPHPSQPTFIQDLAAAEKVEPATGGEYLMQKNGVKAIEDTEEMQLFPGSFKICDLNIMEASQRNEISVPDPALMLPFMAESKREVNLSLSNDCDISGQYSRRGADGKEIEVINLDDDCLQQDDVFKSSETKENAAFMGSQSFPDHAQIAEQENYGLMMSDFLGNDIVGPANVNPLPNDMPLDNGEGILGDDESIYMSLGEIPISFLGVWGQSNQDFDNKPF